MKQMWLMIHHRKSALCVGGLPELNEKQNIQSSPYQLCSVEMQSESTYHQWWFTRQKNVYKGWMIEGPKGTIYDSTPSGWFDMKTFEKWFSEIFLKSSNKLGGPKVIIGDNLGCHFSPKVIETCLQKDIRFITLVPNTTHLCQPLDLAVFRPLKTSWRELLNEWWRETHLTGTIPKEVIPKLLNRAFIQLKIEHLVAGFRGCGIVPVNKEEVLKRLPGKSKDTENEDSIKILSESCLSLLKEHCGIGLPEKSKWKKRGKKVQPGKPVTLEDFRDEENDQALESTPCSSTWKSRKKAAKKSSKKKKTYLVWFFIRIRIRSRSMDLCGL